MIKALQRNSKQINQIKLNQIQYNQTNKQNNKLLKEQNTNLQFSTNQHKRYTKKHTHIHQHKKDLKKYLKMGCIQSAKGNIKINKRNIPEAFGRYNISDKKLVKIYQKYCQQNGVIVRDIAAPEEQNQNNFNSIVFNEELLKKRQEDQLAAPSNYSHCACCNNSSNNIQQNQKKNISYNNININSVRQVNNELSQRLLSQNSIQNNKNISKVSPNESDINSFHENPKIIRNLHLNKLYLKRKIQIHNERYVVQQGCA
ncbi:hypothetical protein TTHERM_00149120 (macronuclear) [Tetrahymena thermophila SB210]|uniref:Uncharacterized protein n=1 Tax=Tetrahymena thermophila (strain SB210) TaxID=312017 RepID=I7LWB2_TETTS|nr:hypothetical protein TTHERM_00149120 [Tetrahymena thermophila SB210]EAS01302.2 hypothetical protein TTHERM_00149120 [Tetrahymena thermophila SB210]|eukprot:XP_001021547.2 hypothetical protein TTHERM_00149120 [Tetrahymena thermophila SB210]